MFILDGAHDTCRRPYLRKVGVGYIFIHRMLQEYFADQHGRILTRPRR